VSKEFKVLKGNKELRVNKVLKELKDLDILQCWEVKVFLLMDRQ
jgi:hypothetical protein